MPVPPDLAAAYRAALYEVDAGAGAAIAFQVGRPCPALGAVLRAHGVGCAALLTACNPRSRRHTDAENARTTRALVAAVAAVGKAWLPGRGRDPRGAWPEEPGLFVLGLGEDAARALARRFDQFAFVFVDAACVPALMFAL